jgi:ABC-type multidrug transport system ATPase subunit
MFQPSGSGKTTLLNVLAGRVVGGHGGKILTGSITANGEIVRPAAFRRKVAYVTQEDALFATATAREALEFSAKLRLPVSTSKADRDKVIDDMIISLGLVRCQNTMVGSNLVRGLSGGERKRVAIGVELVANPTCLFLDEPTSGLDSWSALNVVRILKAISATGCTIICSIHQPSSEVFNSFDSLVLLGLGNVIFQGSIHDVDEPFKAMGLGVPPRTNVADHVMLLIQTRPLDNLPQDNENKRRYGGAHPPSKVMDAVKTTHGHNFLHTMQSQLSEVTGSFRGIHEAAEQRQPGSLVQAIELAIREFKSIYRDKGSLFGRFGGTAFLNVLFAIIFLGAADQNKAGYTVQTHFGALVQIFIGALFGAAQPALLLFPLERIVFIREKATGTYGTIPYVFAKLLVELPLSFFTALLTLLVCYWTVGFVGSFFYLTIAIWGLMLAATSTSYILGSVVSSPKSAIELAPAVLVPQILFLGFFIQINQMPVWLSWANYLCSAKYALNLAMLIEFQPSLAVNQTIRDEWANILVVNSVSADQTWLYVVILLAIFIGFRTLSLILLNEKAKSLAT